MLLPGKLNGCSVTSSFLNTVLKILFIECLSGLICLKLVPGKVSVSGNLSEEGSPAGGTTDEDALPYVATCLFSGGNGTLEMGFLGKSEWSSRLAHLEVFGLKVSKIWI